MIDKSHVRIALALVVTIAVLFSIALTFVQAGGKSVSLCHIPPGNPEKAHVIVVSSNAVPAHLEHGDFVGSTCNTPTPTAPPTNTPTNTPTATTTNTPTNTPTATPTLSPSNTPTNTPTATTTNTPTNTPTATPTPAP